jgi:L-ascorbate 6-phosphate lactonase
MAVDIKKIDRDTWLRSVFPEWGTYLNEEIAETKVPPKKFAMWWLTCCGVWIKTPAKVDIAIDFWVQRGEATKKQLPYKQIKDAQIIRMTGARKYPPFLRISPHVIDPFQVKKLDALLSTHIHGDHICEFVAAAAVKNTNALFIGPPMCGEKWLSWGVPKKRIVVLKPGQSYKIKDTQIFAVESFDRTALITPPPEGNLRGKMPVSMDERAVNYVIKTPGGSIYHSGDSHFSNGYYRHGKQHKIDVALVSYGDNGPGITDKLTASDTLRIGRDLNAKVLMPIHWDMWATQCPDPNELVLLHNFNKHQMKFKLVIWKVGGKFVYPDDQDIGKYVYPKDCGDYFTDDPNIPFPSFL